MTESTVREILTGVLNGDTRPKTAAAVLAKRTGRPVVEMRNAIDDAVDGELTADDFVRYVCNR